MRFAIICLMSLLLVPAFGAPLNPGKQPDRTSSHTSPSAQPGTHTYPPSQHPPPTPPRLDLEVSFGQGVQFKSNPDGRKHTGVILDSRPDKHGMYPIAPYKHEIHPTGQSLYLDRARIVKAHEDDIMKKTPIWIPHLTDGVLRHHQEHPPKVYHTRIPPPIPANRPAPSGPKAWVGGLVNKIRKGGRP
ncbi:hypothetical protein JOM56_006984 [Amanita muscaria]